MGQLQQEGNRMEPKENNPPQLQMTKKRQLEEDHTPLWIKIFGSSILSIAFLCVITLTGYIVSNLNNIQMQLNTMSVEMLSKRDYSERSKEVWEAMKSNADAIAIQKERLASFEQLAKERGLWMEKQEIKITELSKAIEIANKEVAGQKEKGIGAQAQLTQIREENKQLQKDLQVLREKVAALEAKLKKE